MAFGASQLRHPSGREISKGERMIAAATLAAGVIQARGVKTGLSRDWGDEDANDMTGRDVTVPIGCKTHPRPRSLSRQQPVQSYRLRPHPPNLWTVPWSSRRLTVESRRRDRRTSGGRNILGRERIQLKPL